MINALRIGGEFFPPHPLSMPSDDNETSGHVQLRILDGVNMVATNPWDPAYQYASLWDRSATT